MKRTPLFLARLSVLFLLFPLTLFAQRSTRIVDFGHDWGVGFYRDVPPSLIPNVDVDGDGETTDDIARAWSFSLATPLSPAESTYDSQLPSARFYGGVYAAIANRAGTRTDAAPSEGHINQNHEMRDDWNLMALPSVSLSPELESYEAAGLWLWKKEDFLNGASQSAVSFSSPDDFIAVYISRYWGGVNWGRWVIQNGASFFISEPTFGNLTHQVQIVRDAEGNLVEEAGGGGGSNPVYKTSQTVHPAAVRWAPYDPTRPAPRKMFFEWQNSPDYQFRSFDDVQSVGFLVQRDLQVGAQVSPALTMKEPIAVKWNAVQVVATVQNPPASAYQDLVPVGGTPAAPLLWAARTEVSYHDWLRVQRWAVSNQRARNFTDGVNRFISAYSFERDGALGSSEVSFAAEHSPLEPVTTISWYDALVWCNALSEKEGREAAYYTDAAFTTPLRKVFRRNLPRQYNEAEAATFHDRPTVYWKADAAGYRLPTADEWRSLAADADLDPASAWTGRSKTEPVGTLAANSLGLHDMTGNVAEYVWDVAGNVFDPALHNSHRVLGAGFRHPSDENSSSLNPFGHRPGQGSYSIGFRPVRNGGGSLPAPTGTYPERVLQQDAVIPAAAPMSEEALRIDIRNRMPLVEVTGAGTLAPGSTNAAVLTTAPYDVEVGTVEIPYRLWIRVKQWAESTHGYRFNFSGDMGSARHNLSLTRGPDEPVTHISWLDAVLWCNALSELMGLEPVYLDSAGNVEREVPPFRLSEYNTYGYPNLGQYSHTIRPEIDTALIGYIPAGAYQITRLLPNPIRTGFRLPTGAEARAAGGTVYNHWEAVNKTTTEFGWFKDDALFSNNPGLLKAMPVGGKTLRPAANGLHDMLGNVQEWTFGGSSLFGQYRYGNDFGFTSTGYPHTMNRQDHISSARAYLGFRVLKIRGEGNMPPVFSSDPVEGGLGYTGFPYTGTLAGTASDPNPGDVIQFSKSAGPAWLLIAADGSLSGTPGTGDAGLNSFTVTATDLEGASSTVTLQIQISARALPPLFSPDSGTFEGSGSVMLSSETPGSTFRYTLDGSEPTASHGTATAGVVSLNTPGAIPLRAIALHPQLEPSLVSSANYNITPGLPPVFTQQPLSRTVGPGWEVLFTVAVTGTGPHSYEWFKNGSPLDVADSATLTIPSAALDHDGAYTVRVSSVYGNVTSDPATLTVLEGLSSETPSISVEPTPLTVTLLPDTQQIRSVTVLNSGLQSLAWELELPASASAPSIETALDWSCAGLADGLAITQIPNTGTMTSSWTALSGTTTLNGALRVRTASDLNSYTSNSNLGFNAGVHTLEMDLAGWNIPNAAVGQWMQLSFQNAVDAAVTCGLVLQSTPDGVALWGRALGTTGRNIDGNGTFTDGGATGIGTRTPIRLFGFTQGPVRLRLTADFTARTYRIAYLDESTNGLFVDAGVSGVIDSTRNGNALRLRMSGGWGDADEFLDITRIRVTRPSASALPQPYTFARSTQGGPAYAWRDIASTANGGTRLTTLDGRDDANVPLSFPGGFTFPFYGTTFASLRVCSNGFLSFSSTSSAYTNLDLPSTSTPFNLLALLWDDLVVDASASVWWRLDADAFVVTFNNLNRFNRNNERVTAQVLLFSDGRIRFQYANVSTATWTATVGIQNGNGTQGLQVSYNQIASLPVTGEAITFTPPGALTTASWITDAAPRSASLAAVQSVPAALQIDSAGLALGRYESAVIFHSNDPALPSYTLPVILDVVSQILQPAIQADTPPAATAGIAYSHSFIQTGGIGEVQWSIATGALPSGLSLAPSGILSGTPTQHGAFPFTLRVTDAEGQTDEAAFSLSVLAPPAPAIVTESLPGGEVNLAYQATLQGSSGLAPYTWSLAAGSLPAGLTLSGGGLLSGIPQAVGAPGFTLRLTDAYGQTAERVFSLSITAPPALGITTQILPGVTVGTPYAYTLQASGGYGAYTWSLETGTLPAGITLSPQGVLSGTSTDEGSFALTLRVQDEQGGQDSALLYLHVSATPEGRPAVEAGGWNLHYVRYWSQSNFFNDAMFEASAWEHNWNAYAFEYDARGYPVNIPAGIIPAAKITLHEPGHHTLLWQGANSSVILNGSGISLVSEDLSGDIKRRVYNKTSDATLPLLIRVMIQNQIAATDIQVWAPGTLPLDGSAPALFKESFLERLRDNSAVLRFMDWGATNSSRHGAWESRRRTDFYTQDAPSAYEHMIALSNAADKDLWICVPHNVDPAYIENMARLIVYGTDNGVQVTAPLAPHLKVYLEWSNEVWNSGFPQHGWAIAQAKVRLGLAPEDPLPNYNEVWRFIGEKHAETFRIFAGVFREAGRRDSLVRVLGTQIGGSLVDLHMEGVASLSNLEPDPDLRADYFPDEVSIGAYFGHDISTWVLNNTNYTAPAPEDYAAAFTAARADILGIFNTRLETSAHAAARHGLRLNAYEGGQHIVGLGMQQSDTQLTNFLRGMNRDPRMGDLTALALDLWEAHGGGLFMAYNEAGPYGSYGSWGFREHWHHDLARAPKAAAFTNWLRRMQQSHILTPFFSGTGLGDPLSARLRFISLADPVNFSISHGALPTGLHIQNDGSFSGTANDYGTFRFTVQLSDAAGKVDRREYEIEVTPDIQPLSLAPVADTYVASWSSGSNFGTSLDLLSGLTSSRISYVKWDLSFLAGKTINRAILRLDRKTGASGAAHLYRHDGSLWEELSLTWQNRPALGALAATFAVDGNLVTQEVDITHWVREQRGNAQAGLVLTSDVNYAWHSRETSNRPGFTLLIESEPLVLVPTTYENWAKLHFGSADLPDAAPTDDANGDGTLNLMEMALGRDPTLTGETLPYGIWTDPIHGPLFSFPRHSGHHGLRLRVTASRDLQTWAEILYDSATAPALTQQGWNEIHLNLNPALTNDPKLFLRLECFTE